MSIDIEKLIRDDLEYRINKSTREQSLRKYYNNPNRCKHCGEIIIVRYNDKVTDVRKRTFCSEKCSHEYSKVNKESRACLVCGVKISNHNQSGLCPSCLKKKNNEEKIQKWKETGDTGCIAASTLRNCIRDYIFEKQNRQCAICGMNNTWNGQELHFILDHIDGDAANNFESNLRLICPNCDSQLDTYKSKNKNSARRHRKKYYNMADELGERSEPT